MKIENARPAFIEYHALKGTFGKVSYFVTKTDLQDVSENLVLAPQETLTFGERIQRVVNEKRVEKEILPYLEQNDLRFFNSLVCVLLPDNDQVDGFWEFEEYIGADNSKLNGLGKLKITRNVSRVVLDGQHRFSALKKYWEKHKDDSDKTKLKIEISLVFVIIEEIGRIDKKETGLRTRTITAVRNLFATLNKTARSVDKNTLLLIDDSDILNVVTRKLLEEKLLDELFVKWVGGENLQARDPYFTTLQVVKDSVSEYLREFENETENDFGSEEERQVALEKFMNNTPSMEVPLKEGIPLIFNQIISFSTWVKALSDSSITLIPQPEEIQISKKQGEVLEKMRESSLVFTVAGQKALFRAVIDVFLREKRKNKLSLEESIKRANALIQKGYYLRDTGESSPFLGVLYDQRGRMAWAEGPVSFSSQILAVALGSPIARGPIKERFKDMTDRDPSVLDKYWKLNGF